MNWPLCQDQLTLEQFAKTLLETRDLDPVYFGLLGIKNKAQLKRWLVAYWCFYHCGFACYASERDSWQFWKLLHIAAENKKLAPIGERWPRSAERRHFRGNVAIECIKRLHVRYNKPEEFVDYISQGKTLEEVTKLVNQHYLFGSWIAFKCADMLERCLKRPIQFTEDAVLYQEPFDGALMAYQEKYPLGHPASLRAAVVQMTAETLDLLKAYKAPPNFNRPLGVQECETIWCKFKSHRKGHYPVGKDIREIRHGLQGWLGISETAVKFERALPPLV